MGAPLPQYTTSMSATPGHQPTFTGKVELAGFTFTGVPSKTKKQAEKNAAMAAWSSLKQLTKEEGSSSAEPVNNDELEHITVARALLKYCTMVSNCSKKYTPQSPRPTRRPQSTSSRILPLIYPQETRQRPAVTASTERYQHSRFAPPNMLDLWAGQPQNLMHASGANPYAPMQPFGQACRSNVQPVTIRHAVPCYATPPSRPQPSIGVPRVVQPVTIRHAVPCYAAAPYRPQASIVVPQVVRAPNGQNVIPVTIGEAVPVFASLPPLSGRKEELPSMQKEP
ncbi:Double-stranded RNA-binding protein 2 [Linum grandiflorum]